MSQPFPPPLPLPDDDRAGDLETREEDGQEVLDTDVDPAQTDGPDADRLAAEAPTDEERP